MSNFMKDRPVQPSCSVRTDRRADMTKLIVEFRNFAKAPNNRVYFAFLKATCYIINSVFPHIAVLVSGFSRDCVQHAFNGTREHSLGTFREEHLVLLSSSSIIINAVTLTIGRVSAVVSADQIPLGTRFSAPVQTGPGTHSASGSFLGVKRTGLGLNHPPQFSAEVKERVELNPSEHTTLI
jgi:hypothetical protein